MRRPACDLPMTPSTVTPQPPDAQSARSISDKALVQQRQDIHNINMKLSSILLSIAILDAYTSYATKSDFSAVYYTNNNPYKFPKRLHFVSSFFSNDNWSVDHSVSKGMWPKDMAATKREAGASTSSIADVRLDAAHLEKRSDGGAWTPRGTKKRSDGSASMPRGNSRAVSAATPAAGGGCFMGGGFWGEQMLDSVRVEADLDHALLNAKHNRRAGQMYANYKRQAARNDQYPQKRARCCMEHSSNTAEFADLAMP